MGSIAAPNKKCRQWDVRQVLPNDGIFAECALVTLLTPNLSLVIMGHSRPIPKVKYMSYPADNSYYYIYISSLFAPVWVSNREAEEFDCSGADCQC